MGHARWVTVAVIAVLVAGCTSGTPDAGPSGTPASPSASASPSQLDPAGAVERWLAPGPHRTIEADYALADLEVPGLAEPVEVSATVVGPADLTGPVPLVLVLHGYQASCYDDDGSRVTTDWPCPDDLEPFPNAEGFAYLQQRLASHGFLAASVRANGVNVQATDLQGDAGAAARAALLRRHLAAWAGGEVELGAGLPAADLESVLLVGHSRGGEGVARAVAESAPEDPWRIRGEFLLAPTGFEPAGRTQVPLVSAVGYCDGDVGGAPAQRYVDRAAPPELLRSSLLVPGANHNYFNSQWVPGESDVPGGYDDAFGEGGDIDPICDPEGTDRLSPGQQQESAAGLVSLAAGALLAGDAAASDALDGLVPVDLGPGTPWVSAVGNGRTTLTVGEGYQVRGSGGARAETCRGVSETENPKDCGAFTGEGGAVHWPGAYRGVAAPDAVRIDWEQPGGAVELDLTNAFDLTEAVTLELRVVVGAEGAPVSFGAAAVDGAGAVADLGRIELDALPSGPIMPARLWGQQVALAVDGLGGPDSPDGSQAPDGVDGPDGSGDAQSPDSIDLSDVRRLVLTPTSASGTVWVLDVSARPSAPPAS